jgi:hypothetical protein
MWFAYVLRGALIRLAAGAFLRAEEPNDFGLSELYWDGLDQEIAVAENATGAAKGNATGAANATGFALLGSSKYLLAGQFNTGTNLLDALVQLNFPGAFHDEQWVYYWKHRKPADMTLADRANIKNKGLVALVMVRDPLSWLQSMKKAPYDMRACVTRYDWLTAPCSTPPNYSQLHGTKPVHLQNIEAYWNEWARDYQHMKDFGFSDAVVIRYEDLVLDTEGQLQRIAHVLNLPAPSIVRQVHGPAKTHGNANGRAVAIQKLKNKPYLQQYTFLEKTAVCDRLDKGLLRDFDYGGDC